ncbi:hypothetical protein [Sulfurimonas sp.]|uniref:hypothetical protein n=1 Tax=Sulfurimonas sp. TaxID=2022749 RepID=UPI003D0D5E67
MKFFHIVFSLFLLISTVEAANSSKTDNRPSRQEIETALQECFDSLGATKDSHPDHKAVDECMSAKGYEKPEGGPGGGPDGQNGRTPPSDSSNN